MSFMFKKENMDKVTRKKGIRRREEESVFFNFIEKEQKINQFLLFPLVLKHHV